jgi:hypothetical protein
MNHAQQLAWARRDGSVDLRWCLVMKRVYTQLWQVFSVRCLARMGIRALLHSNLRLHAPGAVAVGILSQS